MANLDTATANWLYKTMYEDGLDSDLLTRDNPFYKYVAKRTDFASPKGIYIPAAYSNAQGVGSTHAEAAAARRPNKGTGFNVPQRHRIWSGAIDAEVMRNAEAGKDSTQFADAVELAVDGLTEEAGQDIEKMLWGTKAGVRGLIASISTTTITLSRKEDAHFFEIGHLIQVTTGNGGALRDSGDFVEVTGVDPQAGTIKTDTTISTTVSGATVGDGLILKGSYGKSFDGIQAWCPETVTPGEDFLGVDRSIHRPRLAGVFSDQSAANIRNAFILAEAEAKQYAGAGFSKANPWFCHPKNYAQLLTQIEGAKVVSMDVDGYNVGLDAVEALGRRFVEATFCPVDTVFCIAKDGFELGTAGNQPYVERHGGNEFTFDPDTGDIKFTMALDGNSYSRKCYRNLRVKLQSV